MLCSGLFCKRILVCCLCNVVGAQEAVPSMHAEQLLSTFDKLKAVHQESNDQWAATRLSITLGKALNDPVQLLRLLGAASRHLLTDYDVSIYVGMNEVPICCPPNSAFDAHQAVLLHPQSSMVSIA